MTIIRHLICIHISIWEKRKTRIKKVNKKQRRLRKKSDSVDHAGIFCFIPPRRKSELDRRFFLIRIYSVIQEEGEGREENRPSTRRKKIIRTTSLPSAIHFFSLIIRACHNKRPNPENLNPQLESGANNPVRRPRNRERTDVNKTRDVTPARVIFPGRPSSMTGQSSLETLPRKSREGSKIIQAGFEACALGSEPRWAP